MFGIVLNGDHSLLNTGSINGRQLGLRDLMNRFFMDFVSGLDPNIYTGIHYPRDLHHLHYQPNY